MAISNEEIVHLAMLSKLDLDEEEVEELRGDLEAMVAYVDKLSELDCEGVEPTTHAVPLTMRLRADAVEQPLDRDVIMENAPDSEDGMFRVPRVVNE